MTDHPQLFDALPAPVEQALRASIERFGVLVPIVRDQHGGMIDGRHRKRIADQLGVRYRVDQVEVRDVEQAEEIQRTLNADRRHLSGDRLREHIVFLAQQADERGVGKYSENTIAQVTGVSQQHVNRTLSEAPQHTTGCKLPDRRKGADGKVRPSRRPTIVPGLDERQAQRAQRALQSLGKDAPEGAFELRRIERIAREHKAERRRAEPLAQRTVAGNVDIRHGDFREVLADLSDAAAIITDPPYPQEFVPLFAGLSEVAARILAPHGVLVAMVGQWSLRDYLRELDSHLAYRWCAAYIAQGARTRVHAAHVGTGWKPLLVYQRRDAAGVPFLVDDVFDAATTSAQTNGDKRFHHWGQSEAGIAEQVERFTKPGDLVVDPFLGGGTTALVCKELGRRFVGCDVDAAAVHISRERVG